MIKSIALSLALISPGAASAFDINAALESFSQSARSATGLSEIRNVKRAGSNPSDWRTPVNGPNTEDHFGVGKGFHDDGGTGKLKFGVKADANGTARVVFQDIGDTKHFASFSINGQKVAIPEPARTNGGRVTIILTGLKEGVWNGIRAVTKLVPGASGKGHAQDHIGVCARS